MSERSIDTCFIDVKLVGVCMLCRWPFF